MKFDNHTNEEIFKELQRQNIKRNYTDENYHKIISYLSENNFDFELSNEKSHETGASRTIYVPLGNYSDFIIKMRISDHYSIKYNDIESHCVIVDYNNFDFDKFKEEFLLAGKSILETKEVLTRTNIKNNVLAADYRRAIKLVPAFTVANTNERTRHYKIVISKPSFGMLSYKDRIKYIKDNYVDEKTGKTIDKMTKRNQQIRLQRKIRKGIIKK